MLKTMYDYRKYASYEAYADAMKEEEKKRAEEWKIAVRANELWEKAKQEGRLIPQTVERVKNYFGDDNEVYVQADTTSAMNQMKVNASRLTETVKPQPITIQVPKERSQGYLQSLNNLPQMQQQSVAVVQPESSTDNTKSEATTTTTTFAPPYQKARNTPVQQVGASTPWYSVTETIGNFLHQPEQPQVDRRDPREITRAAERAIPIVIAEHGTEKAACNIGVRSVFKQLHNNSTELDGMMANDMARYWSNDTTGRWEQVRLEDTQELANRGEFVVAAWENPTPDEYGHVAVIVPGEMVSSGKWKTFVPQTMDTGIRKRESKQMLSIGFGPDKKETTKYYKYNPR